MAVDVEADTHFGVAPSLCGTQTNAFYAAQVQLTRSSCRWSPGCIYPQQTMRCQHSKAILQFYAFLLYLWEGISKNDQACFASIICELLY